MPTPINWPLFLWSEKDTNVYRYDLRKPFVIGDWKYATDSIRIVRIPTTETPAVSDVVRKLPDVDALFRAFDTPHEFKPWPEDPPRLRETLPCRSCVGVGLHDFHTCPVCFGAAIGCAECREKGIAGGTQCDSCNGHGKTVHVTEVRIGPELWISADSDNAIRSLDNPRYACLEHRVIVEFDGGQAIVMAFDKCDESPHRT